MMEGYREVKGKYGIELERIEPEPEGKKMKIMSMKFHERAHLVFLFSMYVLVAYIVFSMLDLGFRESILLWIAYVTLNYLTMIAMIRKYQHERAIVGAVMFKMMLEMKSLAKKKEKGVKK